MDMGYVGQETIEAAAAKLREQAASWTNLYNEFVSYRPAPNDPKYSQWLTIYESATNAKEKIQGAFDAIGNVGSWIGSIFGLNGSDTMQGLGVLPIVIVGAALTAIGLTAYQMKAYLEEAKRLEIAGQLVREGKADASLLKPGTTIFDNLQGITKWVVIGGGLYLGWMLYKESRK